MSANSSALMNSLSSSSALSVPSSLTSPIPPTLLPPPPTSGTLSTSSIAPHALDPQYLALEKIWREKVRAKNCACKLMTREEVERIIQILEGILTPKNFNEKVKIKKFSVGVNEAGQRFLYRNAERGRKGVQYPQRIVVACEDLFELLKLHHDGTSVLNLRHVGFQKTVHQLREAYYGLDDDVVRAYIQNCALCKLAPPSGSKDSVKSENNGGANVGSPGGPDASSSTSASSALLSLSAPSTFSLPYSVPVVSGGQTSSVGLSGIPAFLGSSTSTIQQPSNTTLTSSSSSGAGSAPCCLNCTSACAGWTHHFSSSPTTPTFEDFRRRFSQFSCIRNWYQYHTPRNLLIALTGEIGELAELFQWRTDAEAAPMLPGFSIAERDCVAEELSDIALYLIRLADRCGVDLPRAMERKMEKNARKYPAEIVFGSHQKYTAYQQRQQQPGRIRKRKSENAEEEDDKEEINPDAAVAAAAAAANAVAAVAAAAAAAAAGGVANPAMAVAENGARKAVKGMRKPRRKLEGGAPSGEDAKEEDSEIMVEDDIEEDEDVEEDLDVEDDEEPEDEDMSEQANVDSGEAKTSDSGLVPAAAVIPGARKSRVVAKKRQKV